MNVSAIAHFDQPMTRGDVERLYASNRLGGDPTLTFEEITPTNWKVSLHPQHTAPMQLDEFKRFLRLRLHCRTD